MAANTPFLNSLADDNEDDFGTFLENDSASGDDIMDEDVNLDDLFQEPLDEYNMESEDTYVISSQKSSNDHDSYQCIPKSHSTSLEQQVQLSDNANIEITSSELPSTPNSKEKDPKHIIFPTSSRSRKRTLEDDYTPKFKRLLYRYNPNSGALPPVLKLDYVGESISGKKNSELEIKFNIKTEIPKYFTKPSKNWEDRFAFFPNKALKSHTSIPRLDLYVMCIDANFETKSQLSKSVRRCLTQIHSPVERFVPSIWQTKIALELNKYPFFNEPYEDALKVSRLPHDAFKKVPVALSEPTDPVHPNPPKEYHCLSPEGQYLLDCDEPIDFFLAIFRTYELRTIVRETNRFRKQKGFDRAPKSFPPVNYDEIKCFIGLILWTSLVPLSDHRKYFRTSEIYHIPAFVQHMPRDRFEQIQSMIHFTDNSTIPTSLSSGKRFEAKIIKMLDALNANSRKLISPARDLSIDEMMVRYYGRSVLKQYIKRKPNKYGIKLWALCCSCCGYSISQNLFLGSKTETVGGRDVVLNFGEIYFDKGHVIYCDSYFSFLDLAAYLRSRKTGLVGTSNISDLPEDLGYLVRNMHPLCWAFKWFEKEAKLKFHNKGTVTELVAKEKVCLTVWYDKKYRSEDKKVVFISNCLPSIPSKPSQFQEKNIWDPHTGWSRQPVASPPIVKAYNHKMGGVDRHNSMVSQLDIPLTSKRGYMKIFYHILNSACVNAFILYKSAMESRGLWNKAAKRRHRLDWFKENVVNSLVGTHTSRLQHSRVITRPILPLQSVPDIIKHQIRPVSQVEGMVIQTSRCSVCSHVKRTACQSCKVPMCYKCGISHIGEMLQSYTIPEVSESDN